MEPDLCPRCGVKLLVDGGGVLTLFDCPGCGWTGGSVGTPAFQELPRANPVEVFVRATGSPSVEALIALRRLSQAATDAPLSEVKALLANGVSLGSLAPYRAKEVQDLLERLGIQVTCRERIDEV
jgi:hypothetical protein